MKNKIHYTDAPEEIQDAILQGEVVEDFLPPPQQLIAKEETRKITIALSKRSVDFFKDAAEKNHIPYQQLIRKVLDNYTEHYTK
jgi:predicted DNA binding CopG/RHH family protein